MGFMRHRSRSTIEIGRPLDAVFNALVACGQEIGKVKQHSKLAGYVVIRTPMELFSTRNAATVRVAIKKRGAEATTLTFESDCLDGVIGLGSAGKAIDLIIMALEKHLLCSDLSASVRECTT